MYLRILFLFGVLGTYVSLAAQEISQLELPQAYTLAQKNYPAIKEKALLQQSASLSIENIQKNFLPQFALGAQASYQSDVTRFGTVLPGLSFQPPARDQYKLTADISQLVFDGGMTREQKVLQQLNASVDNQKLEVELYQLKDRINQFYLGVLYMDEQLKQADLVKNDIRTGIKQLEAQVQNGLAFKSGLNMLKAELLKADQRTIEINAGRKGLLDAFAVLLGQPLSETVILAVPASQVTNAAEISRPELILYKEQANLVLQQNKLIDARNKPRTSLFMQGGYARPGLNILKKDFDFYFIGGLRFQWPLGGLYTRKKEKEIVELNSNIIDIQKETFLLNTNTRLKQQESEISKMQQLISSDHEIIELRTSVTTAAKAQLENGVINANDFLKEVNAEDQARQALITHQLLLLQAQINYQNISGKQ